MACSVSKPFGSLSFISVFSGSCFLPVGDMRLVFEYQLDHLPDVPFELSALATYLRRFWLPKCSKICVWDEGIPRTTNVSEGYHNGMRTSFKKYVFIYFAFLNRIFSDERPNFRTAFDVHVGDLADSAYEFLNTNGGTDNLKKRLLKSVTLDKKLIAARAKLVEHVRDVEFLQMDNILR